MVSSGASSTIWASSIGAAAWRAALSACRARVIGVTVRGLFLLTPPQQVIFVSFERFRSPLTINVDQSFDRLRAIQVGAAAQFTAARLIFPSIEFSIGLAEEAVWQCPSPGLAPRPPTDQLQMLRAIAEGVLPQRRGDGLAALLPGLLDLPDALPLSAEGSMLFDRLIALRRAVPAGDNPALLSGLLDLLGQGRGLTPAGDDVTIGLLLTLNRWRSDRDWTTLNHGVIAAAYRATTAISANLIELAAAGQGDERLIIVADGIATGSASIADGVECVLGWGSSSGIAALLGMAVTFG